MEKWHTTNLVPFYSDIPSFARYAVLADAFQEAIIVSFQSLLFP